MSDYDLDEFDSLKDDSLLDEEEEDDDFTLIPTLAKYGGGGTAVKDEDRISMPILTKYEKARVLGSRALQISKNSFFMLEIGSVTDPYKIAEMELKEGRCLTQKCHVIILFQNLNCGFRKDSIHSEKVST